MAFAYNGTGEVKEASDGFKLMDVDTVYEFDIVDAEETQSKAGNQMLKLTLQPTCAEFSNRQIWHYIVNNDYWEDKIASLMASAGKDVKKASNFDAHHLMGWKVRAKLKHEEYNGKTSEKIWFFIKTEDVITPEPAAETVTAESCPF